MESIRRNEVGLRVVDVELDSDEIAFRMNEPAQSEFVVTRSQIQLKDRSFLIAVEFGLFLLVSHHLQVLDFLELVLQVRKVLSSLLQQELELLIAVDFLSLEHDCFLGFRNEIVLHEDFQDKIARTVVGQVSNKSLWLLAF